MLVKSKDTRVYLVKVPKFYSLSIGGELKEILFSGETAESVLRIVCRPCRFAGSYTVLHVASYWQVEGVQSYSPTFSCVGELSLEKVGLPSNGQFVFVGEGETATVIAKNKGNPFRVVFEVANQKGVGLIIRKMAPLHEVV